MPENEIALSVSKIMSRKVVSVTPETPLSKAVNLMLDGGFAGLPVVNENSVVIGILTDYDLTIKGSALHLPTFLKLIKEFEIYKKDSSLIRDDLEKILKMKVSDAMNAEPLVLKENTSVEEAVKTFGEHHRVNPIPIVDESNKLVGIISRRDIIKLFGSKSGHVHEKMDDRLMDEKVNQFLGEFENRFVLVSKTRTRYWLIFSIIFAIIGFVIAFALIVR